MAEITKKCPECHGSMRMIWQNKDGTAKAFRCRRANCKHNGKLNTAYLVRV